MGHLRCRPWDSSVPTWALRTGFAVIVAWLCAGAVFERTAPSLAHSTGAHLTPPSGSRSERAFSLLEKYFGGQGHVGAPSRPALSSSSSSVLGPGMGKRTPLAFAAISSTVQDVSASAAVQSYEEWVSSEIRGSEFNASFGGLDVYGLFLGNGSAASKAWMLSPNKRVTLMVVYSAQKNSSGEKPFARYLLHHIANVSRIANATDGGYRVMLGGEIVLDYELDGKAVESLRRVEMLVLPVAFVILAYFLQRVQLLLVPLCCVALSLGAAFSCALPLAEVWSVSSDTPEIMVSTAVALSIDYSLFLLTRLLEGIKGGATLWQSVQDMVANTGHTITVSGGLIALAFLSALLMPISTIRSAGLLTAITAMTTVVANLTLIPAMLVCFGNVLLAPFPNPFKRFCCKPKELEPEEKPPLSPVPSEDLSDYFSEVEHDERAEILSRRKSAAFVEELDAYKTNVWYRLADFTRRHSTAVIIVVLVLGAPIIAFLPSLKISVDRNLTRARGAESIDVLQELEKNGLEAGRLRPSHLLLMSVDQAHQIMSPAGFKAMAELADGTFASFNNKSGTVRRDIFTGVAFAESTAISYDEAMQLMNMTGSVGDEYRALVKEAIAGDGYVTAAIVSTPFRIYGPKGGPWVNAMRDMMDRFNARHRGSFEVVLASYNGPDVDAANIVESHIPLIMGVICVSVMVIVGLVFRSLLLPLRLAFALAYTIAITLGVAVLVYQTEWLWWLFPYLAQYENEGLSYAVPAVVIPVCVALGLDYDIFLLTRVLEYRLAGMDDVEAVVMSVGRTGSTISGAGIIMSVAFGGLLASSETQLNQFGLLLTVSVLLDTFVIRTIFVPALMCKAASYNWWPRAMPPVVGTAQAVHIQEGLDVEAALR
eukprot:Rhum_TRINITY_DN14849_c0_g1::Rhum_TRINITY_DN14849_c0_g1_i3::g.119969::m.119969/K06994/K06994; putative drug exporter of the RND superfamily